MLVYGADDAAPDKRDLAVRALTALAGRLVLSAQVTADRAKALVEQFPTQTVVPIDLALTRAAMATGRDATVR